MKYEVFFLLQQYYKKYPERFHKVEPQELKEKYTELDRSMKKTASKGAVFLNLIYDFPVLTWRIPSRMYSSLLLPFPATRFSSPARG